MTGQTVLLNLLGYIGVKSFKQNTSSNALNRPSVSQYDIDFGLAAINAALKEIFEKGPVEFKYDRVANRLHTPTAVVVNVIEGAGASFVSGQADWMIGCSIQIAGDPFLNEIIGVSGPDISLLRPYPTVSQSGVTATVYSDAILLADTVQAVLEPVELPPNRRLTRAQSRGEFDRFAYMQNSIPSRPTNATWKTTGVPAIYFVEPKYDPAQNYLPLYLRLNPMPDSLYELIFSIERKPEKVDEDIYSDDDVDPGYEFSSVPAESVERVLLPVARRHFTAHPAFKNQTAKQSIMDQYKDTITQLEIGNGYRPSHGPTIARYVR
jgi:hypothetical protein